MKRNDRLNEVFRKFRQKRALRRFISLFSVFVLLLTINTLKMNADTLERIPSCGIAEHEHGADCFDEAGNLVCGMEAHVHTDACYQERPKGDVTAEAVDTEVREADDQELDGGLTDDGANPEEGSAEAEGDAIQSGAVDAAVDEIDGLTLDDAAEDGDAAEGDDTAEGGDTAVDGEPAEDAVEEVPGTPTYSIRNREFVLASELAGAMGLDLARVKNVTAVENEDGTVSGIGVEALDGDWLIYAAREFDEAEVAFILDEGIEVAVLTDGVPLTAPESDQTAEGSSDEVDLTDSEEDTADDAEGIADAQANDAQVAAGSEDGTVAEDNDVEIGDDAADVAGDADENVSADENAPADEDAADANASADEDADDEDAAVTDAGDEAVAAKADTEAEGDKIDEADEDGVTEDNKADEEKADEEKVDEEKVDEEKSDEGKVDEEKSDEEKADEEKSDEEKSDEEKSDEEKVDEEKSDEEKSDEEKADEDAKEGEDAEDTEDAEGEDAADAEDESADGEADDDVDGDTDGESGASGSDEAEGAEVADGQAASPVADDHTLTVDLSEEQNYPLSLRGLMSIFQTAPVAEQPQVEAETEADADAAQAGADAEADAPQAEDEAGPAEAEAEAVEPQADTEATEVGTVEDAVVESIQEETLVGSEAAAEPEAGEAVEVSDIEAIVEEYVQSEAVEAAAAEVEVTMAAPEPVVASPEPVIDPEAALALSIEYDETLLSVEESGEDWLITPVAAFERTELTVGGVYTIAFINCTVEAPVAMPAQTFEGATDYITVKVEAGEGAFPEGTTMQLADIEDENVLSDIGDAAVTDDFVEVKRVHAVDITFRDAEGNEIEPLIPISVVMSVREIEQDQQTVVVHVDDEGNAAVVEETEVPADVEAQDEAPAADDAQAEAPAGDAAQDDAPAAVEAEGGEIAPQAAEAVIEEASEERVAFMADAFSIYAMVVTQKIETKVITAEGETYNITVSYGPEAQIPMGATLSVSEIEGDAAQGYLERTEETLEKAQVVTRARFFDIKIMDGETEVQPAVPVTVQAVLANDAQDEAENADAVPCAVHFADETVEQPDVVEAAETGETVVFRAASFSVWGVVYTVDFHWTVNGETFDYSIPGGDCASLRDLLGLLNMVADDPETEANELDDFMAAIESVTFSAPELVRVHKIEEDTTVGALRAALEVESEYSAALTDEQRAQIDARALTAGDWALFSLKPFSTLETLTVAMDNGDTFAIAVTDAQITTRVLTASGERFVITLDYGPEAMIPLDATLEATEIEKGSEAYEKYMADAAGLDEVKGMISFARFFDIQILHGEEKIEPAAPVHVTIAYEDAIRLGNDDTLSVVHFAENDNAVEPEVITDIAVNNAGTEISYTQNSFSVTGTIISGGPSDGLSYVVIVKYNDHFYSVSSDGSLVDADGKYNPETGRYDEVEINYPLLWKYTADHGSWGGDYHNLSIPSLGKGTYSFGLAQEFVYRYINPKSNNGISEETAEMDNDQLRAVKENSALWYDETNHRLFGYVTVTDLRYIGVNEIGDPRLIGNVDQSSHAAEVYLATLNLPMPSPYGDHYEHVVDHIDISVVGSSEFKMPLAYGEYYNASGEVIYTATKADHILTLRPKMRITTEDMKVASIVATNKNTGAVINNAFCITGYSQNIQSDASNDNEDDREPDQVRIEGSFKVADLPVEEGKGDNDYNTCQARLNNRILYTVSVPKTIKLEATYGDQQLYRKDGDQLVPLEFELPITLSASFDYWDERNECPPLHIDYNPDKPFSNDKGRAWKEGKIVYDYGNSNALTGMDFRLGTSKESENVRNPALEIKKVILRDDGSYLETNESHSIDVDVYSVNDRYTNLYHELENIATEPANPISEADLASFTDVEKGYIKQHTRTITTGLDGTGAIYDYDVEDGMYYIKEDEDSVDKVLTCTDGHQYRYSRTEIETEYVWRCTGDDNKLHYADGMTSVPEVLGAYVNDESENAYNTFLEYYIYNIYKRIYPVKIKKVDSIDIAKTLAGAEFDLYGPYDALRNADTADATHGRKYTPVNTNGTIAVDGNGIGDLGNLESGIYYLYETKAPAGFNMLTEPVVITVNSRNENPNGEGAVTYTAPTISKPSVAYDPDSRTYTLTIPNSPGARLPETGGVGTTVFYVAGGLITLLALVLLIAKRRAD